MMEPNLSAPHIKQAEPKPEAAKKILRPGMLRKMKALAAASVVGLAGATMSDNAEAQHSYGVPTYNGNTEQHVVVSGKQAIGNVLGAMVVNQGLKGAGIPAQVVGMQNGKPVFDITMNKMPAIKIMTDPAALQVMNSLGLAYSDYPFYIVNPRNPSGPGQRLGAGPSTLSVTVIAAGQQNVFADMVYVKNNQRFIQRWVIGARTDGTMVASLLADQIER